MVQSNLVRRRATTLSERLTPCECCGHPLSQRHHLVRFAKKGESEYTAQLCANCHEIYHVIAQVYRSWYNEKKTNAGPILGQLQKVWGIGHPILKYLHNLVTTAQAIEGDLGIAEL